MLTQKTKLSECGNEIVLDEKDRYQIRVADCDCIEIIAGHTKDFNHPNLSAKAKVIHEFKHYRDNGSKFWTSRAGIDYYFVVPKSEIYILPEKGYSYIKAEINGVKVTFNVSGGTNNGWTDYLLPRAHISVNHKLSDLKKIAEVSIKKDVQTIALDADREKQWNELMKKNNPKLKEHICKLIEENKSPTIVLRNGLNYMGEKQGKGIRVERRRVRGKGYVGAMTRVIIETNDYYKCRVKVNEINWTETEKLLTTNA